MRVFRWWWDSLLSLIARRGLYKHANYLAPIDTTIDAHTTLKWGMMDDNW